MNEFRKRRAGQRRADRRFRPVVSAACEGSAPLDRRVLLSADFRTSMRQEHAAAFLMGGRESHSHESVAKHAPKRLTPIAEVNLQYAKFLADFDAVLESYVESLDETSTNTVFVSTTVTKDYVPPASVISVADAAVFGPQGMYPTPIVATTTIGTVTIGTVTLNGSSDNLLILKTPANFSMNAGTTLSANIPASAASSAAAIFPSFINNRTVQLANTLVKYFNSLPLELPKSNAPPHTPVQRSAIQKFTYLAVAGMAPTSLRQSLLAISLPTTPGADLDIYQASVESAVEQSRVHLIDSIQQIYAGNLLIPATPPANRLGIIANPTAGGASTATTGSSSTRGTTSGSG
jgi:hypothetical protein